MGNPFIAKCGRHTTTDSAVRAMDGECVACLKEQVAAKDAEIERLRGILRDAETVPMSEWATELAAMRENVAGTAALLGEAEARIEQLEGALRGVSRVGEALEVCLPGGEVGALDCARQLRIAELIARAALAPSVAPPQTYGGVAQSGTLEVADPGIEPLAEHQERRADNPEDAGVLTSPHLYPSPPRDGLPTLWPVRQVSMEEMVEKYPRDAAPPPGPERLDPRGAKYTTIEESNARFLATGDPDSIAAYWEERGRLSGLSQAAALVDGWHVSKGGYTELARTIQSLSPPAEPRTPQPPKAEVEEGFCPKRTDETHCNHWWDTEDTACCNCGHGAAPSPPLRVEPPRKSKQDVCTQCGVPYVKGRSCGVLGLSETCTVPPPHPRDAATPPVEPEEGPKEWCMRCYGRGRLENPSYSGPSEIDCPSCRPPPEPSKPGGAT